MKKTKSTKKTRAKKVILPPTMDERGALVRKLAETIENTWPPSAINYCGNVNAVVAAFRPETPGMHAIIMRALHDLQRQLVDYPSR